MGSVSRHIRMWKVIIPCYCLMLINTCLIITSGQSVLIRMLRVVQSNNCHITVSHNFQSLSKNQILSRDKTCKMACAPSEDLNQPGHPHSLISEDSGQTGQADLSLCWAHIPFCWFCLDAAHFFFLFFLCVCVCVCVCV